MDGFLYFKVNLFTTEFQVETEITKDMVFVILARYTCFCIAILENGDKQVNSREGEYKIASELFIISLFYYPIQLYNVSKCSSSMFKDYKPLNNNNKRPLNHKDVFMFDFNFIIKITPTCDWSMLSSTMFTKRLQRFL